MRSRGNSTGLYALVNWNLKTTQCEKSRLDRSVQEICWLYACPGGSEVLAHGFDHLFELLPTGDFSHWRYFAEISGLR
jgi:hypothetical protein